MCDGGCIWIFGREHECDLGRGERDRCFRGLTALLPIYVMLLMFISLDQFPGKDPRDCPRDIGVAKAKETKCNNYKHPDKFGHYREAKYTATKHHW